MPAVDVAPGILWVTFTFSGLLGLHRSFGVEAQDRAMDALLVAPVPREAIFLGKALANFAFVVGFNWWRCRPWRCSTTCPWRSWPARWRR